MGCARVVVVCDCCWWLLCVRVLFVGLLCEFRLYMFLCFVFVVMCVWFVWFGDCWFVWLVLLVGVFGVVCCGVYFW